MTSFAETSYCKQINLTWIILHIPIISRSARSCIIRCFLYLFTEAFPLLGPCRQGALIGYALGWYVVVAACKTPLPIRCIKIRRGGAYLRLRTSFTGIVIDWIFLFLMYMYHRICTLLSESVMWLAFVGKLVNPFAWHAKDRQFESGRKHFGHVSVVTSIAFVD